MKKQTRRRKKLSLSRNTLRRLSANAMSRVAGGTETVVNISESDRDSCTVYPTESLIITC